MSRNIIVMVINLPMKTISMVTTIKKKVTTMISKRIDKTKKTREKLIHRKTS